MLDAVVVSSIGVAVAVILYGIFNLLRVGRRPTDIPPGPPTLPILGNLHQMPKHKAHLQFQKWSEEYGPVYSLILGTKTYIVLSSDQVVKDLLDKRSSIYSSRPDMYIGQDVASGGHRFVVMQYGPFWRFIHKMMHNTLNIRTAVAYVPYQDLENKEMMLGFLNDPKDFVGHLRRFSSSLTTQMVFGFRTISRQDPRMLQFFKGFEAWGEIVGSASAQLLDLYPILRKLPESLAPNVRHAKQLYKEERHLYVSHWIDTKRRIQNETCPPCFSVDVFLAQKAENFSDDAAGYITGSLLEAGSDTTSGILTGFIQAMLVFPEVLKKSQEEIDRVIGPDRMPTMDDMPDLPYIRACVKESLRWMPTVILGVPHAVLKEDFYMGYRIPEGATIINNVWALNMDPKRNPNPRVFDPSRFKDDNQSEFESATNSDPTQRQNWVFGAGRRLCQGMHIAERSLFLAISRLVWAYNFEKAKDANGRPITPDTEDLIGGLTVVPADFEAIITPRSKAKADIIKAAWKHCEDELLDPKTKQWISDKLPDGMKFSTYLPDKKTEMY